MTEELDAFSCPSCASHSTRSEYMAYDTLHWMRCDSCGFKYMWPYVSELRRGHGEAITATYASFDDSESPSIVVREKVEWVLREIADQHVHCVELGPGRGQLLVALRDARPEWSFVGIEPFEAFRESVLARGLSLADSLEDALDVDRMPPNCRRVLLIADNVLEHVEFPAELLRDALRLTDASRVSLSVMAEVPNESGIRWRAPLHDLLRGNRQPPTFPGHINLFSSGSLDRVMRRAGFTRGSVRQVGLRTPDHVAYVMRRNAGSWKIRAVCQLLRLLPIDRALGVAYHLRASYHT